MTVTVALLGRPNAGKSTLFNALARGQRAIVHATPGTTRDARRSPAQLHGLKFDLLDTAGWEAGEAGKKTLAADLNRLAERAATQADLLVYLIDGASGPLPADRTLIRNLRKLGKPFILVLTKADLKAAEAHIAECETLGLGAPVCLSAAHRQGMEALHTAFAAHITDTVDDDEVPGADDDEDDDELDGIEEIEIPGEDDLIEEGTPDHADDTDPVAPPPPPQLKLALLGRPNAGKSTLANRLLGAEKMLTGPIAGLTREAITHTFRHAGQEFLLTDTPGLRRKAKIHEEIEHLSVGQAIEAARNADVALLLVDASGYNPASGRWQVLEQQDAKIAQTLITAHRPLIVALAKWDLVEEKQACLEEAQYQLRRMFTAIPTPLCLPLSAHSGQGVGAALKAASELHTANYTQHATSFVNRTLQRIVARRSPPLATNHMPVSLKFARQTEINPPTIALFGSRLVDLPKSYKQFLRNSLAQELGFQHLAVRLRLAKPVNPFANKKKT